MLRELFSIPTAYASVESVLHKINKVIINPFIILLFTIALMYFLWGIVNFINADGDEDKTKGKQHMFYGVIGMFIMIAAFAIMQIIVNSIGAEGFNIKQGTVDLPSPR